MENTNVKRYALAAVLLAACGIGLLASRQPAAVVAAPEAAKPRWEYMELVDLQFPKDSDKLGKLGDEGWELVAVASDKDGNITHAIFKRPKGTT
jgi:hypothetical protein